MRLSTEAIQRVMHLTFDHLTEAVDGSLTYIDDVDPIDLLDIFEEVLGEDEVRELYKQYVSAEETA